MSRFLPFVPAQALCRRSRLVCCCRVAGSVLALLGQFVSMQAGGVVLFTYAGTVSLVAGTDPSVSGEFALGDEVRVAISYDPDVGEDSATTADPDEAVYLGALRAAVVVLSSTQQRVALEGGEEGSEIRVRNDRVLFNPVGSESEDSIRLRARETGSEVSALVDGTLLGEELAEAAIVFEDSEATPGPALMLTGDGLPAQRFLPDRFRVHLLTTSSRGVEILAEPVWDPLPEPSAGLLLFVGAGVLTMARRWGGRSSSVG